MAFLSTICKEDLRRAKVRDDPPPAGNPDYNGIDYLEVSLDQRTLRVFFLKPIPLNGFGLPAAPQNVEIRGGVRIRDIQVTEVRRAGDDFLEVDVDREGDFSIYTLVINSAILDPVFAEVEFSFKAGCETRFDCKPKPCLTEPEDDPNIDYLAKDYASFRRALLDLVAARVPGWTEYHASDVGIMLLELLAYTGDEISYYQDSVSNEAFLETALQRISVRRHARLVDYHVHDGSAARAFVHFRVTNNISLAAGTQILARIDRKLGPTAPPHPHVLPNSLEDEALEATAAVFETFFNILLRPELNELSIHTWQDRNCCLPLGATTVDLTGNLTSALAIGSYLLFEEIRSPVTGVEEDADRTHRQIVRLNGIQLTTDPIGSIPVTRISWASADALTFPLCISAKPQGLSAPVTISVARGNLVLADHGRTLEEWFPEDPTNPGAQGIHTSLRPFRLALEEGPLTFRIRHNPTAPVADLLRTDPSAAQPEVATELTLNLVIVKPDWTPIPDLFAAGPFNPVFVVETDNEGIATLRFGDDVNGQSPPKDGFFSIRYRVGNGSAGNVGIGALAHVINNGLLSGIVEIRNPLAAWGGVEPEAIERVRQLAPAAFHAEQFRAVTEPDYAAAAEKHPRVSKAAAKFRWTGSWLTVFIAIDPKGGVALDDELKTSVLNWVTRYTLAGYDLEIRPPLYIALNLEIDVCVSPDHFQAHVGEAVFEALSNRDLPARRQGFFHPDRFTFGESVYLSRLIAAVQSVEGVNSATVVRFSRFDEVDPAPTFPATQANLDRGYIKIAAAEIVRLDNDPNFPENGALRLNLLGGKG